MQWDGRELNGDDPPLIAHALRAAIAQTYRGVVDEMAGVEARHQLAVLRLLVPVLDRSARRRSAR